MATKIRLKRLGKKFYAFYRVVISDSRNKRNGKSIEEIGIYDPNKQPSLIQIKSDRAQYWLGVGAQPTEPVLKLKGLEGAEGTLKTGEAGPDAQARVEAVEAEAQKLKAAKSEAAAKAQAAAEAAKNEAEEAPAADAEAEEKAE